MCFSDLRKTFFIAVGERQGDEGSCADMLAGKKIVACIEAINVFEQQVARPPVTKGVLFFPVKGIVGRKFPEEPVVYVRERADGRGDAGVITGVFKAIDSDGKVRVERHVHPDAAFNKREFLLKSIELKGIVREIVRCLAGAPVIVNIAAADVDADFKAGDKT